jgi:hypothetical protein
LEKTLENKRYNSKIGIGMVTIITLILIFASLPMIIFRNWTGLIIILALVVFFIYLFLTTDYTISGKELIIKCGFLYKSVIKIDKITKLKETNNILSSPATSFDRIAIYYSDNIILVSPKDKIGFIDNLLKLNPRIEIILKEKK